MARKSPPQVNFFAEWCVHCPALVYEASGLLAGSERGARKGERAVSPGQVFPKYFVFGNMRDSVAKHAQTVFVSAHFLPMATLGSIPLRQE